MLVRLVTWGTAPYLVNEDSGYGTRRLPDKEGQNVS